MNAFLHARTAFGFEYLISFRVEHSDADRDITGIEGLLFKLKQNKTLTKIEHSLSLQTKNPLEKLPTPNMIR